MSEYWSIIFETGVPDPWPAFVSILIIMGFKPVFFSCISDANLNEWAGTTLSSWSAVVINVEGYKTLKDGQKVEFEIESNEKGERATNVTPV